MKEELEGIFSSAYTVLRVGTKDTEKHRKNTRLTKFTIYRLSVLGINGISDEITDLLLKQPWNIPVWISCRALARGNFENHLIQVSENSASSFVSATAIKAMGNVRSSKIVSKLASILDNSPHRIERSMASEALININSWGEIEPDRVQAWIESSKEDPYLLKNIIILLGLAYPKLARSIIGELSIEEIGTIVQRALHYNQVKTISENLLMRHEPEIFKKYRASSYPIIEELLSDESSYTTLGY